MENKEIEIGLKVEIIATKTKAVIDHLDLTTRNHPPIILYLENGDWASVYADEIKIDYSL